MKKIIFSIILTGTIFTQSSTTFFAEEHPDYVKPMIGNSSITPSNDLSTLEYHGGLILNEEHPDY